MKRSRFSILSLVALATLAGLCATTSLVGVEEGCVYGGGPTAESSVCNALSGYFASCSVPSACGAAYVRDCAKVSAALSALAIDALFECARTMQSCDDAGSAIVSTCAVTGFTSGQPSDVQKKLAGDYCAVCGGSDTLCTENFYHPGGAAGLGPTSQALASDATIEAVDAKCIPGLSIDGGATACLATFTACAAPIAAAAFYIPPECIGSIDAGVN